MPVRCRRRRPCSSYRAARGSSAPPVPANALRTVPRTTVPQVILRAAKERTHKATSSPRTCARAAVAICACLPIGGLCSGNAFSPKGVASAPEMLHITGQPPESHTISERRATEKSANRLLAHPLKGGKACYRYILSPSAARRRDFGIAGPPPESHTVSECCADLAN